MIRISVRSALYIVLTLAMGCESGVPSAQSRSLRLSDIDKVRESDFSILFVGNSHISRHDVPSTVGHMIQFLCPGKTVFTSVVPLTFLEDAAGDSKCKTEVASRPWRYLVLQGQKISVSGQFDYSRAEGIAIAKQGEVRGARVFFFSEWGLKGVPGDAARNESIYQAMARESKAEVIAIGRAWDYALKNVPEIDLFEADGNHQNAHGAFLTSCLIVSRITGDDPKRLRSFPYPGMSDVIREQLINCASASNQRDASRCRK